MRCVGDAVRKFGECNPVIARLSDMLRDDIDEIARERCFHPVCLRLDRVEIADPDAALCLVDRIGGVETVWFSFWCRIGRREYRDVGAVDRLQDLSKRQSDDIGIGYELLDRYRHGKCSPPKPIATMRDDPTTPCDTSSNRPNAKTPLPTASRRVPHDRAQGPVRSSCPAAPFRADQAAPGPHRPAGRSPAAMMNSLLAVDNELPGTIPPSSHRTKIIPDVSVTTTHTHRSSLDAEPAAVNGASAGPGRRAGRGGHFAVVR